jgi:hypothetical protein
MPKKSMEKTGTAGKKRSSSEKSADESAAADCLIEQPAGDGGGKDVCKGKIILCCAGFVGQKRRKKIPSKLYLLLYKRFHLYQHSRLT